MFLGGTQAWCDPALQLWGGSYSLFCLLSTPLLPHHELSLSSDLTCLGWFPGSSFQQEALQRTELCVGRVDVTRVPAHRKALRDIQALAL